MKKLFCFILALFLVVCIGCDTIDNTSSIIAQLNDIVKETDTQTSSLDTTTESVEESSETTPSVVSSEPPASEDPSSVGGINEKVKESQIAIIEPEPVEIKGEIPMSYSYITDEQKRIYKILTVAIRDMEDDYIDLQIEYNEDNKAKVTNDINVAFRAVSFDNPEFFWIPSSYALLNNEKTYFIAFKYTENGTQYDFPFSKSERDTMKKQLDKKVKALTDAVKDMDAFEAEEYFHDYLCKNVTYFKTDTPEDYPLIFTTYGALVDGSAVCEGYSRAMQLLCNKIGIPCGLVYGWSHGEGHMWNLISIGDGWYHLDVTWDDDEQNGVLSHRYFNVTKFDITFQSEHIIADAYKSDERYEDLDVYNFLSTTHHNKKYNYFEWKGLTVTTDYGVAGALAKNFVAQGYTYFEIKNNTLDHNENIVSYIAGQLGQPVKYYETYDVITIIL